jgi:hypothetical protein
LKGHDVFSLGRGRAVSHPWNTELIHQHTQPAREKGFLIGMRTLQLFESALNARSASSGVVVCSETGKPCGFWERSTGASELHQKRTAHAHRSVEDLIAPLGRDMRPCWGRFMRDHHFDRSVQRFRIEIESGFATSVHVQVRIALHLVYLLAFGLGNISGL